MSPRMSSPVGGKSGCVPWEARKVTGGPVFQYSSGFFFPLKLIGDVSYSQRCLIMKKKELPFVYIQDLLCHMM